MDINLNKELPHFVGLRINGRLEKVKLEYLNLPARCNLCQAIGHDHTLCPDTTTDKENPQIVTHQPSTRNRQRTTPYQSRGRSRKRRSFVRHRSKSSGKNRESLPQPLAEQRLNHNLVPKAREESSGWQRVERRKRKPWNYDGWQPNPPQQHGANRSHYSRNNNYYRGPPNKDLHNMQWVKKNIRKQVMVDSTQQDVIGAVINLLQNDSIQNLFRGRPLLRGESSKGAPPPSTGGELPIVNEKEKGKTEVTRPTQGIGDLVPNTLT